MNSTRSPEPVRTELSAPSFGALELAFLGLVLLAAVSAVITNNADADLWGHVQYGRDVLETGQLATTTTYSFTADGHRWINHENLSELLLAIGADVLGPVGLVVVKTLLGAMILLMVWRRGLRRGLGVTALSFVILVIALNLTFHWSLRPQLSTYVFFALMLGLLSWCFQGWEGSWRLPLSSEARAASTLVYSSHRLRFLWLLVPLMAVWTNCHGGFVAGLCILVAFFSLRIVEIIATKGWAAAGMVRRLTMMIVACCLATFLNPYGPNLHLWLLGALGRPRPEIDEWHAPSFLDPMSQPFWLLMILVVVAVVGTRRSRDLTHTVILALTIWQALRHQRHVPFVAMTFGFWFAVHLDSALRRWGCAGLNVIRYWEQWAVVRWAGVATSVVLAVAVGWQSAGRLTDLTVMRHEYPVSALQFMADQQLEGNLVVAYDWAQYVIDALGAREPGQRGVRVAFDGRFRTCYPQNVIDMHFDFALGDLGPRIRHRATESGRFDPTKVLHYGMPPFGPPDLVLVATRQPHSVLVMQQQRDKWVLLYQDDIAQLWGRASRYDDPRRPEYVPSRSRQLLVIEQKGSVTWPALPQRSRAAGDSYADVAGNKTRS